MSPPLKPEVDEGRMRALAQRVLGLVPTDGPEAARQVPDGVTEGVPVFDRGGT
jgi:hypothetical protein